MPNSEFSYRLDFRTPVSVCTGLGVPGLLDRTVIRTAEGLPYVPGSTVKGRLRFFAERLVCSRPFPGSLWFHPVGQPACRDRLVACTICRLFGNPSIPSMLKVRDAQLTANWRNLIRTSLQFNHNPVIHPDAEIRPRIALSRTRRAALRDHVFFDEVVPALTFSGTLLLHPGVTPEETGFLIAAGALVDGLGTRKSAGRGRLKNGIQIKEAGR